MKKYMTMPDVKIVRFEANDIIVTSGEGEPTTHDVVGNGSIMTQERNSLWD